MVIPPSKWSMFLIEKENKVEEKWKLISANRKPTSVCIKNWVTFSPVLKCCILTDILGVVFERTLHYECILCHCMPRICDWTTHTVINFSVCLISERTATYLCVSSNYWVNQTSLNIFVVETLKFFQALNEKLYADVVRYNFVCHVSSDNKVGTFGDENVDRNATRMTQM